MVGARERELGRFKIASLTEEARILLLTSFGSCFSALLLLMSCWSLAARHYKRGPRLGSCGAQGGTESSNRNGSSSSARELQQYKFELVRCRSASQGPGVSEL